jgi:ribosome assembly protein 4
MSREVKRQKTSNAEHVKVEAPASHDELPHAASSSSSAAAASPAVPAATGAPAAVTRAIAQFVSTEGVSSGPQIELPIDITKEQLHHLLNKLLENEEQLPYSFFLKENEEEILNSLSEALARAPNTSTEEVLSIVYQPQAIFRVKAVTRCTSTIPGHAEAVLHVQFSGNGQSLATGSGDTTVRIWDVLTETPKYTLKGHRDWVLALAWSPNGRLVASGGKDNEVRLWDYQTGKLVGKPFKGHTKWISALAWEPLHKNFNCTRLASASKDGDIRIWDVVRRTCVLTFSGHTQSIQCLKWGGQDLIYSGSQDRSIKVWAVNTGKLVRTLDGHAHWVNNMSLNTDYAMRTGAWDHKGQGPTEEKEGQSR